MVKILSDSTCDINAEEAEQLGVTIIPMSVSFGDDVYRQGVDLSTAEFYEKLGKSQVSPTTAQLTPYDLEMIYREETGDGSELVAIHLSSVLSGTYNSAVLAASEVDGVYPVDSLNATFGIALLVRAAAKMRDQGKSGSEIANEITALTKRVRLYAHIPSLKYLVRGGRVSAAAGVIGGVLNICPIIGVKDGAVVPLGKARGKIAACREIARLVKQDEIDPEYGVAFAHAKDVQALDELRTHLEPLIRGYRESGALEVGSVIGTHTGPGAAGITYIAKP